MFITDANSVIAYVLLLDLLDRQTSGSVRMGGLHLKPNRSHFSVLRFNLDIINVEKSLIAYLVRFSNHRSIHEPIDERFGRRDKVNIERNALSFLHPVLSRQSINFRSFVHNCANNKERLVARLRTFEFETRVPLTFDLQNRFRSDISSQTTVLVLVVELHLLDDQLFGSARVNHVVFFTFGQ